MTGPTQLRQRYAGQWPPNAGTSYAGDCWRTALAALLGCEQPRNVPHFVQHSIDWLGLGPRHGRDTILHGGIDTHRLARQWLRSNAGLDLFVMPWLDVVWFAEDNKLDRFYALASIPSRAHESGWHTVVVDAISGYIRLDPTDPDAEPERISPADDDHWTVVARPYEPAPDEWARHIAEGRLDKLLADVCFEPWHIGAEFLTERHLP